MTPGDAILWIIVLIVLIRLVEILPKISHCLGSYTWPFQTRQEEIARRIWEERQRFEEMDGINRQIEEMERQLKELHEKERQRRSSPEFTLLRPSEDNHSATLLRASQSDTQKDDGTSLLRAVTKKCDD
jgi:hypothetical protein